MNSTTAVSRASDGRADLVCIVAGAPKRLEGSLLHVESVDGQAWITREGDRDDYVIGPGDAIDLVGEGLVVIESLTPLASVRLTVH